MTCAASSAGSRAGSPRAMPHSVATPSTRTWRRAAASRVAFACIVVVVHEAEIELGPRPRAAASRAGRKRRRRCAASAPAGERTGSAVCTPAAIALMISTMIPRILRLHQVLVRRAAIAKVIAELDRRRHGIADFGQHGDRLGADIHRARFVIALPGQHLLAHVPLDRDAVVGKCPGDRLDLADEMLRSMPAAGRLDPRAPCCCRSARSASAARSGI